MNTPTTRDFLRRPDARRRRSARQALAVIPNVTTSTLSPGEPLSVEVNAMDNFLNSRHGSDSWSPAPSPDELVIQKRGRRRKTIVWSPDLDVCKRNSLFSLSSRDRTPVKSPSKSTMMLRSTPRKRLSLGDPNEAQYTTPEKKKKLQNIAKPGPTQKQFGGNLASGLRGLSHDQLVEMIMDLVSMQEEGLLSEDEKISTVLLKKMPVADIRPLIDKLNEIKQNICASMVSSNLDDTLYSRAYIHLDAFQKAVVDHGKRLMESQHWISLMEYVCEAWNVTRKLSEWENESFHNMTHRCFKNLTQFCLQALKKGNLSIVVLDAYADRLDAMTADCDDIKTCLLLLNDAKCNAA